MCITFVYSIVISSRILEMKKAWMLVIKDGKEARKATRCFIPHLSLGKKPWNDKGTGSYWERGKAKWTSEAFKQEKSGTEVHIDPLNMFGVEDRNPQMWFPYT